MKPLNALHILVVDNNTQDRENACRIIDSQGHISEGVGDGQQALEACYHIPFDLVLMDLYLPGMDGFETTEAIRTLPDKRGNLPILALTFTQNPEDVHRCFKVGMSNFILKPLSEQNFSAAVQLYTYHQSELRKTLR